MRKLVFTNGSNQESYEIIPTGNLVDGKIENHFIANGKIAKNVIVYERATDNTFIGFAIYKNDEFQFMHTTDTMEFMIEDMLSIVNQMFWKKIIK